MFLKKKKKALKTINLKATCLEIFSKARAQEPGGKRRSLPAPPPPGAFPGHRPPVRLPPRRRRLWARRGSRAAPAHVVRSLVEPGEGSEQVSFLLNLKVGSGLLPGAGSRPAQWLGKGPEREPGGSSRPAAGAVFPGRLPRGAAAGLPHTLWLGRYCRWTPPGP